VTQEHNRLSRAPYACRPEASLGRVVEEPPSPLRSPFQRDRDRIVHATAFRRLEYKTQVFVNFEGDHFRTRLTHSLEVAQIARTVSRVLEVDEDLAEAVALAHDLGHSPFGHAGERALDEALREFGGFDHNLQTFRVLTELEQRYAGFDGLNVTFETLEGVVKHNGPLGRELPPIIAEHPLATRIDLTLQAPVEAQIAAVADDIAYSNHDVDDGLRAGFFVIDQIAELRLVGEVVEEVRHLHAGLEPTRLGHEVHRRLIDRMVRDLVQETGRRLQGYNARDLAAVREAAEPVVAFSAAMASMIAELRGFLHERMYRHYKVNRMSLKAHRLVTELIEVLMSNPDCLPGRWRELAGGAGSSRTAGAVRDYIAGMTDRFALDEHDRLFKLTRDPS
jgi:dGTPase